MIGILANLAAIDMLSGLWFAADAASLFCVWPFSLDSFLVTSSFVAGALIAMALLTSRAAKGRNTRRSRSGVCCSADWPCHSGGTLKNPSKLIYSVWICQKIPKFPVRPAAQRVPKPARTRRYCAAKQ